MAFKYNGTSPTTIKYGSKDLTVLKYGTTAVWGKPYSLSISAGANTTVTVSRTSSPNQHASTGTLSSGSVIYYGDVLTISYSVSSGYKISTATVNGSTFTSGASFTVTSTISVVTTAEVSASWHTIWSGSFGTRYFTYDGTSTKLISTYAEHKNFKSLKEGVRTRITLTMNWYEEVTSWGGGLLTITLDNGGNSWYNQTRTNTDGTSNDFRYDTQNGNYCCVGLGECGGDGTLGYITLWYRALYTGYSYQQLYGPIITKVEQYY